MSDRSGKFPGPPKLHGPDDFQNWRYVARVCIEDNDPLLVGLTERPPDGTPAATMRKWVEANAKARRVIVCALGTEPLARFGGMPDTCTAKELWDALENGFSVSNAQAILNTERDLEDLKFNDKDDWQKHMNAFHQLVGKLAALGSVLSAEDKKFKLMRTLPESLDPIAMIANSSQMDFDGMISSVQAELSRRRASSSRASSNPTAASASASRDNNIPLRGGINKKNKNMVCWICRRRGHVSNECWYPEDGEDRSGHGRR